MPGREFYPAVRFLVTLSVAGLAFLMSLGTVHGGPGLDVLPHFAALTLFSVLLARSWIRIYRIHPFLSSLSLVLLAWSTLPVALHTARLCFF
jgi:hypothetical protein